MESKSIQEGSPDSLVMGTETDVSSPKNSPIDFRWSSISYSVPVEQSDGTRGSLQLLHSMTGTARGGRLLAIMGPSGAGKSTLMNALIGRLQLDKDHLLNGCVFLNDTIFCNRYKKLVSFVAQDDIVMGKETPAEALYFSCRVRLGLSPEEAQVRTDRILRRMHLDECRDTCMGVPGLVKGVSGGEKKRTNIGTELIVDPYVMLLDEPTSGLDSVNALRMAQLLRDLAHRDNRTVVCTIHSPSSELFSMFDDLMLLAKGHVVYHGPVDEAPAYFASIGFPVPLRTNPSEYYMNVLQLPDGELEHLFVQWESHLRTSPSNLSVAPIIPRSSSGGFTQHNAELDAKILEYGSDFWTQLTMLSARSWRNFTRDPGATKGRTAQTVFFSILAGLFFFKVENTRQGVQDRAGALFMVTVNNLFMAAMSGIATFPPERAVFLIEQSNESYNAFTYSFAKTVAELPFQIGFPILFSCITYFMIGFHHAAAQFFIFLFQAVLLGNVGYSLGLAIASLAPTAQVAMAMAPMFVLPLSIVAGLFANTSRLDPYFLWLTYISFVRYGYVGFFVNEFGSMDVLCAASDLTCGFKSGSDVIRLYGFENYTWYECAYALVLFMIGLKLLAAAGLWFQGKKRRGHLSFKVQTDANAPNEPVALLPVDVKH